MRMWGLVAAIAAIAATSPAVADPAPQTALAGFDAFVEQTIKDWRVPGLGVAIVKDGRVVLARGYGARELKSRAPFDKDTLFPIASSSKAFTAMGVAILVDEGKLSWDAPVREHLSGFGMVDPAAFAGLSLRDMLAHRSGLPRHDAIWYHNTTLTRPELAARIRYMEPTAPFRTRFQYNNIMFVTAGQIVERVAGQDWETFTRTRIFEPLGMTRTNLSATESSSDANHYTGYRVKLGERIETPFYKSTALMNPAGGIYSTPTDMSRWLLVQTNGGKSGETQLVSPALVAEMQSPVTPIDATSEHPAVTPPLYAMGWFTDTYRGLRRVHHGGNLPGASMMVSLIPDKRLGVSVMANLEGSRLPEMMVRQIIDRMTGLDPIAWTVDELKKTQAAQAGEVAAKADKGASRKMGTRPAHGMGDYAGVYSHPGYGPLTVTPDGKDLRASYNGDTGKLEHWHYETFDAVPDAESSVLEDLRLQFVTDMNGRVAGVNAIMEAQIEAVVFKRLPDARLSDLAYRAAVAGDYDLDGQKVTIAQSGDRLQYIPEGGRPADLLPGLEGTFVHGRIPTVSVRFVTDKGGAATSFQIFDASGVYTAERK